MKQLGMFITATLMLCVASVGHAQNIPGAGRIKPTYAPGLNQGGNQGQAAPNQGPRQRVPGAPDPTALRLAPVMPSNRAGNPHPQAIDNPDIAGDPRPFKYGYGLSKYDAPPTKFDTLGTPQGGPGQVDR